MSTTFDADVLVAGLGTAGAAATALCARHGLRVIGLDAQPLDRAGPSWGNAVPDWCFEAAGFAKPKAPERISSPARFHLIAGFERVTAAGADLHELSMPLLMRRLLAEADRAGADLRGGVRVQRIDGHHVHTNMGSLRARWVLDAAGMHGVSGPRVPRAWRCIAAQRTFALRSRDAAEAWFTRHGAAPGEVLCFSAIAGGYAILNLRLDGDHLAVLTGALPGRGHRSGPTLMDHFVAEHDWVGDRLSGGQRAIPLIPPPVRLHDGPLARIGDAAGQVYAMHGSGVGAGLIAARLYADTIASGLGPEGYTVAWQRRWGGSFAASWRFMALSATLKQSDVATMMRVGLMTPTMLREGLEQHPPGLPMRDLPGILRSSLRAPAQAAKILPVAAAMAALRAHHAAYPRDPRRVAAWARARQRWL